MKSTIVALFAVAMFAGLSFPFLTQHEPEPEEEQAEAEDRDVTESQLELYIEVYKAMQTNHGLAIEEALKPHNVSLEEFRDMERRIQKEQRYVERVRKALLEHARTHAAAAARRPDAEELGPTGR